MLLPKIVNDTRRIIKNIIETTKEKILTLSNLCLLNYLYIFNEEWKKNVIKVFNFVSHSGPATESRKYSLKMFFLN